MAKTVYIDFKKGDRRTHIFRLPIAEYSTGGKLHFAAKAVVDNDGTDALAVINKTFLDASVTVSATHASWSCVFEPADLAAVSFTGGADVNEYSAEFQYVTAAGVPTTYPGDNNYLVCRVYADIKRGVA